MHFKPKIDDSFIEQKSYPIQAAAWIKENLNVEEIKLYNEYNYGSYLIFENIPVFVDSRSDLYMPEFNENTYVFSDFLKINGMNIDNMEEKFDEYGFTHFIIKNNSKVKKYFEYNSEIYKKIYPTQEIEDKYFTIFERMK